MKNKVFFFTIVFFLFSGILFGQGTQKNSAVSESQTQQSLETITTELEKISKSLLIFNQRLNEFLENLNKYKGIQLSERQQKLLFGYEVLNQTEQLASTLRKSLIETGEREATIRRRIIQIEFDLRPENIDRSIQLQGTTKTEELRSVRRLALETERNVLKNTLVEVENSRAQITENLRQTEQFAQGFRRNLLNQVRQEISNF